MRLKLLSVPVCQCVPVCVSVVKTALNPLIICAVCLCASIYAPIHTCARPRRREENFKSAFYTGTQWHTKTGTDGNKRLIRMTAKSRAFRKRFGDPTPGPSSPRDCWRTQQPPADCPTCGATSVTVKHMPIRAAGSHCNRCCPILLSDVAGGCMSLLRAAEAARFGNHPSESGASCSGPCCGTREAADD
jgi:hypothetical protein